MATLSRKNSIDSMKLSMELQKLNASLEDRISVIEHKKSGINMTILSHSTPIYLQRRGNKDYLNSFDAVQYNDEPRSRAASFGKAESVQSLRRKIKDISHHREKSEDELAHCVGSHITSTRGIHNCETCSALSRINPRGRRMSLPATLVHVKPIIKLKSETSNSSSASSLNSSRGNLTGSNKVPETFDTEEIDMHLRRVKRELGKRKPKSISELRADMTTTYQHRRELEQVENEIVTDMMHSLDDKYYKELEGCRYLRHHGSLTDKQLSVEEIFDQSQDHIHTNVKSGETFVSQKVT
ncbi:uncharacterized protein LOC110457365 isoform X2 [Mizuhopecten yessoensis]|nr:uncharacterized protein LOC110457365 isoform X2 [Mizuhopecten yessoensis]XP_021364274.1 uncharacterized protein LOC110457365 isoform X2 [Mizuhopecten yessoensis]